MSMGYDDDDPRREAVLWNLRNGIYRVPEGEKPNTRRKAAMPDRLGSISGGRRS